MDFVSLTLFLTVFLCSLLLSFIFAREAASLGICQDPRRPPSAKPTASHPIPPFVEALVSVFLAFFFFFCLSLGNFFVLLYCLNRACCVRAYVLCVYDVVFCFIA